MKYVVLRNACLVVAVALLAGCSGGTESLHKVSGSVMFQGKPVPNVTVIFTPKGGEGSGRPGTAVTDGEGKFASVTTYAPGDGVIPGSHAITLATITNSTGDSGGLEEDAYATVDASKLPFPAKYLNTVESDITITVSAPDQTFDIVWTE